MPRYMFRVTGSSAVDVEAALSVAASRFPEIGVEHRFLGRGEHRSEVWVCTAPSETHVVRWATAVSLAPEDIDQVDDLSTTAVLRRWTQPGLGDPPQVIEQEEQR
jgi:hypothetical protein